MLKFFIYLSFVLLFSISCGSAAQQQYKSHSVQKGETVYSIAKEYNITEETLYNLNPDVRNGLKINSILILPSRNGVINTTTKFKEHRVKRKETLFGIAQLYNVNVEDIKKLNKELYSRGLRNGEKLRIPISSGITSEISENPITNLSGTENYIVKPKETKYGIARKFGITVAELEALNPDMGENLKIGASIVVPNKAVVDSAAIEEDDFEFYEVKPKEGFFRLKTKFGISEEEIVALNPYAKEGLKEGMILKLPKGTTAFSIEDVEVVNLENRISNRKMKTVALMLPFRLSRSQNDTTQTDQEMLKKDPTLRVALDFYSGALMAAEFAKDKGISVTLDVYDTEKSEDKVASIISKNDFKKVDAVIGPLMQKNVEKAASLLKNMEIPVFSPLSNREMVMCPNFFQTLPTQTILEKTIIHYIKEKGEGKNIIIISDAKTQKSRAAILAAIPSAKSITPRSGGYVQSSDITSVAQSGTENWVILESSNPILVSSAVGALSSMPNNYQIRLFTLDKNDAFDWHEVSSTRLAKLNFTFPSVSRNISESERQPFYISYKNKYGIAPNRYVIRGFDVTYDVLLRLASADNMYDAMLPEQETVYVENKFRYIKTEPSGYSNLATYILKYNKDLEFEIVK